ncbi:MAG TPA: NADH-quinone oxidoreductase subunit B family protein [Candidatus Omnitrophota bacterium]|jgi:Ni,Fe-hydrogenase III small subunit|nr:NADH-quinone oxidoreductase subunit B family protein [Candidatus Omnitrophota bacterium]HQB93898.1 NADH-quinone oxidoreductase subunit B family protein [Candidatus Omnitrophota bacterium]
MLKILMTRFRQGCRTMAFPKRKPPVLPARYRGRPLVAGPEEEIDLGKITFVPDSSIRHSNDFRMATCRRQDLVLQGETYALARAVNRKIVKLFGRSLKLRQVSAGGCNACEADTNVLNTPVFDLSRFGIQFVASPRHADGVLVTGPVTRNMKEALLKTYEAVPDPKIVIAVGACAISGGIFSRSPEVSRGLDTIIPVDLYIPGCPPHPMTILDGFLRLLGRLKKE